MSDQTVQKEYRQARFTRPPGATEILLVRHGESAPMQEGVPVPMMNGQGDPPLDPVGEHQAQSVADRLLEEDLSAIYVTTLQRTAQTAAPLATRLGMEPVVEPDLREVFLGEWEGGEIRARAAAGDALFREIWERERWDVIPGAEPHDDFDARVWRGFQRIVAAHRDQIV